MSTPTAKQPIAGSAEVAGSKPLKVFRHRHISVSVFENASGKGEPFVSAVVQRTYKIDDEYRHSSSFGESELPIAMQLMQQAWAFMLEYDAHKNG